MNRHHLALLLGIALALPMTAEAQEPTDAERAEARTEFQRGVAAARERRWEDARTRFQRAYDIMRTPAVLVNLGGAQRQTGQLLEAAASYRAFLEHAEEGAATEHREAVERALEEVEEATPRVHIRIVNGRNDDQVSLDGTALDPTQLFHPALVNPGEHTVELRRQGERVTSRGFTAVQGGSVEVVLEAPAPRVATPEEAARTEEAPAPQPLQSYEREDDDSSVFESPWLWAGVGAVVAAATVVTVVMLSSDSVDPFEGNVPPGHIEVR